jgi:CheY-like chemotaxis protein
LKDYDLNNSFINIIFGYISKEKEEEYKYFFFLNIFKSTKNVILITSILYFLLGIFDIIFNDINFLVLATIKISVSLFGFLLVFTTLLQVKRVNFIVLLFYLSALSGIIIQMYYNANPFFYILYSAGLLSIISVFFMMSGVRMINSIISNLSVILVYLYIISFKVSETELYGHLVILVLGTIVSITANYLNEKSNRENYRLIKMIESSNRDKLSDEIKQKQNILTKLQELNDQNKELQQKFDLITSENENSNISVLINSINDEKNKKSNNNITKTIDNYDINEIKQANFDLSRMLNEINENINSDKSNKIINEQFNLHQLVKDIALVFAFSSNSDKLEFIVNNKYDRPCLIISDQVKLKQVFISLLFHLYNKGARAVSFSYDINTDKSIEFGFRVEKYIYEECKAEIEKTLVPIYLAILGGEIEINNNYITLKFKENNNIKNENNFNIVFKKEYVLIIDDDSENLSYIEFVIKNLNANVIKATDGIEAIKLFKENNNKIEIVIMDVNMPGINGNEAAKYMKEINPNVPILLVTAYSHYQEHIKNGDKLLLKPFSPKTLIENISQMIN